MIALVSVTWMVIASAACDGSVSGADGAVADLSLSGDAGRGSVDLASAGDLPVGADLATPADLAVNSDLAGARDLPMSADLAGARDLAATPDLASTPDMAVPPGMVRITGGTFMAGRGDVVTVRSFYLDRDEVTVAAYKIHCVGPGPCAPNTGNTCTWGAPGKEQHPVSCVSFAQASAHCRAAGRRLPTEPEWEWVARGGPNAFSYPWGNVAPTPQDNPQRLCWSSNQPCAVGSYPAGDTAEGVRDIAGNVEEWTSSCEAPPYECAENAPGARAVKGGWWLLSDPNDVKVGGRALVPTIAQSESQGFRCARDL